MPQRLQPTSNDPASNMQTGARVALAGMLVNFVLAVAKITAGLLGNSYVLIADGIESALDIAGSAVIWGGLKFAARPPDATHPYGHGKAEPMAAGIVAAGVIIAAIGLAIQSVREILTPHHAPAPFTLIVLIIVIIVKEFLYPRGDPAWQRCGEHGGANRCVASSQRRSHFCRRICRHFHRASWRAGMGERR